MHPSSGTAFQGLLRLRVPGAVRGFLDNTIRWIPGLLELPAWCVRPRAPQPRPSAFSLSGSAHSGLYLSTPTCHQVPAPESHLSPARGLEHPSHWPSCSSEALTIHRLWCHHCAHGAQAFAHQNGHRRQHVPNLGSKASHGREMAAASTADVQAQRVGVSGQRLRPRASIHTPGCQ